MTARHLVLIPAYDAGPLLAPTVAAALAHWTPVWVVDDGSTDGAPAALSGAMAGTSGLRVL
ncbi:glycosyltransferase, partial [Acidisphaera rubrifaciens]|uniref:glycosyltransferase n=1 Tax=Acidisphaera rubrifaciens TaxID=50715 RepID=UPI000662A68F